MRHRQDHSPSRPRRAAAGLAATLACFGLSPALAAPPVYVDTPPKLSEAATQPLRDLNLMHREVAPPLKQAKAAPYRLADAQACAALKGEIADLDAALGPDVDSAAKAKPGMVKALAADALSNAVKIPFRGVVRKLSGAERRDRERQDALMAGMARRAFLKGVVAGRCEGPNIPYLDVAAARSEPTSQPTLRVAEAPRPETAVASPAYAPTMATTARAPQTVYVWQASDTPPVRDDFGGR